MTNPTFPNAELPSEEVRTAQYNAELIRRYRTGQYLTAADKREARELIAAQSPTITQPGE